jgi:hypothetical protein
METEHIAPAAEHRRQIVERLLKHYLAGTVLPGSDDAILVVWQLQRLLRYIIAEGYGR